MIALDASPLTAVGIAEARAWLRIDGEEEDALLAGLIRSASALCEQFIGQPRRTGAAEGDVSRWMRKSNGWW